MDMASVTFFDNKEHLRYEGLPKDDFRGLVYLRFSDVAERAFCGTCYSPIAMRYKKYPDLAHLTLSSVNEDSITIAQHKTACQIKAHIFVSQKAWWYDLHADGVRTQDRFTCGFEAGLKDAEHDSTS
jgi:hypothetical protein